MKWMNGSPISLLSATLAFGFVLLCGLCVIFFYMPSFKYLCVVCAFLAMLIFFAGYISMLVDHQRYQKSLLTEYKSNPPKHISVFAGEPADIDPENIEDDQRFSLFCRDTAGHIGDITASDLRFLVNCYEKWGHKRNDFFVMPETVAVLRAEGIAQSVAELLDAALAKRQDSIEIRWTEKTRT
jgi:hypothetical protein